jgi:hypothetical protein
MRETMMNGLSLVTQLFSPRLRAAVLALAHPKTGTATGPRIVTNFGQTFPILKQELSLLRGFLSDEISAIMFGER